MKMFPRTKSKLIETTEIPRTGTAYGIISDKDIMIDFSEENNFFSNTNENINNQTALQA